MFKGPGNKKEQEAVRQCLFYIRCYFLSWAGAMDAIKSAEILTLRNQETYGINLFLLSLIAVGVVIVGISTSFLLF